MTNWFLTLCGSAAAPYRMFGFPFSGGSAVAYADWKAWLRDDIHFLGVQLPGRGMRMTEPLIHNMGELVPQLIDAIGPQLDRPYFLYGHSNGAMMAFLVANGLLEQGMPAPIGIMLSAKQSPTSTMPREQVSRLSEDEFVKKLKAIGGTPKELLENHDLMAMCSPSIRADFSLGETFEMPILHPSLSRVPALIIAGDTDEIPLQEVFAWTDVLPCGRTASLVGGHFLIQSNSAFPKMVEAFLDEHIQERGKPHAAAVVQV